MLNKEKYVGNNPVVVVVDFANDENKEFLEKKLNEYRNRQGNWSFRAPETIYIKPVWYQIFMATKVLEDGRMDYHELLEATVLFLLEAKVPFQGEVFNNIYGVFARYMLFGGLENPVEAESV